MWHDVRHIAAMNQRQNDEMVEKRSVAHIAMAGAPFLAAIVPGVCFAQSASDDAIMAAYRDKTQIVRPCRRDPGSIVVCGSRAERNARERIPLPEERDAAQSGIVRNEAPRASAAKVKMGSCGIVASESAGCNGGLKLLSVGRSDPSESQATVLGAISPILDASEPDLYPAIPDRYKGATPP